ncbi:MAG: agmatinase family protein, partial [bacterium]
MSTEITGAGVGEVESMLVQGIPTFLHKPLVPLKKDTLRRSGADIAVVGFPFEMGPAIGLPGASLGPRTIRLGSEDLLSYHIEFDIDYNDYLTIVDCGDVAPKLGDIIESLRRLEVAVSEILAAGAMPIIIGGDHSIPIAAVKALHDNVKGKIGMIHFDSHMDTWDTVSDQKYINATPITRCAEYERVDPKCIAQIGMSGYLNPRQCKERAAKLGITTFFRQQIYDIGIKEVTKKAVEIAKNGTDHLYLTFDIDCVDCAFAPATSVPAIGGLTTREVIEAIRILRQQFGREVAV